MVDDSEELTTGWDHAKAGNEAARGALFERFRPYLRLLAERQLGERLGRRLDPSDIVQETFLEAHRDFKRFQGSSPAELAEWLRAILDHNLAQAIRDHALAAKRAIGREQSLADADGTVQWLDPASADSSPSQRAMRGENAVRLALALERLPADQREAVRLRHLEGWPLARIAERMDRSLVATAGLIKRGLQALREYLPPET